MFEMHDLRLIVRASGTDAVMRYYIDGTDRAAIEALTQFVREIRI